MDVEIKHGHSFYVEMTLVSYSLIKKTPSVISRRNIYVWATPGVLLEFGKDTNIEEQK